MDDAGERPVRSLRTPLIVMAIALVVAACLPWLISQQAAARSKEVRGSASDYGHLAATPVIRERIAYFPHAAKNIEYWCRPYWNGICASFDIEEADFVDWALGMRWRLEELRPGVVHPLILLRRADGSDEYLAPVKNGYFLQYQVLEKGGRHLGRDFTIVYDKTTKRAYFTDSDGRTGPPAGGAPRR